MALNLYKLSGSSRGASAVAFLWGLAESVWFFVIPDVWLTLVAARGPRRAVLAVAWAVGGALTGGACLYLLAARDPQAAARLMASVPLVFPSMATVVSTELADGWWAMVEGPSRGIPYKLYAAEAGQRSQDFSAFLFWTVVARSYRMAASAALSAVAAATLRRCLSVSDAVIVRTWAITWIAIYLAYALLVTVRYG